MAKAAVGDARKVERERAARSASLTIVLACDEIRGVTSMRVFLLADQK